MNKSSADPNLLDEVDAASSNGDSDDKAPSPGPSTEARLEALERQIARIAQLQEAMAKQALGRAYPPPESSEAAGSSGITNTLLSYLK